MKSVLTAATLAALLATVSPVWAQNAANGKNLSAADQQFLTKAAQGNAAEASLGQTAMQQASQPAVKEFGRWMHTDHTLANEQLIAAAKAMHQSPPSTQPNAQQQATAQSLQQLNGAQFDQQYMQHMVTDHQQDVQDYQKEAADTHNRMLKAYTQAMIPVIQAHLAEAQELASLSQNGQTPVAGTTGTAAPAPAPAAAAPPAK